MIIKKLLKRFLKDENLYGSELMKKIIEHMDAYDDAILPFNAFRWDTTLQGHDYWFAKEVRWLIFLYKNYSIIDEKEKGKYSHVGSEKDVADRIKYVSTFYRRPIYDFKENHSDAVEIIQKHNV